MVSVPVDLLDAYQDIPFGTPAWKRSYGRPVACVPPPATCAAIGAPHLVAEVLLLAMRREGLTTAKTHAWRHSRYSANYEKRNGCATHVGTGCSGPV